MDNLQPLLDQELNGLLENYRLPILLCDLEGKTIKEHPQIVGADKRSGDGNTHLAQPIPSRRREPPRLRHN
jgi:hypothetical protein